MKKLLSVMACVAMVLVGGVALAACGAGEPVTLTKDAVVFEKGDTVSYKNNDTLKITKGEKNTYEVSGTASFMDADQAAKWGTEEGAAYVVVTFKYTEGAKIVYKNAESGTADKGPYDKEEDFTMIFMVKDPATSKLVAEVTEKDAKEATTYTVTFKDLKITKPAETPAA